MSIQNHARFSLEAPLAGQKVNLDALVPREDFESDTGSSGGSDRDRISLSDLEASAFFAGTLRKPDFQRETTHWGPDAVVDLIKAFLEGHLIPAVILWQSGDHVFVIDGAHRLSALISWIRDDYGDGTASISKYGSGLTEEQRKIADRVRKKVRKDIGPYAEFKGLIGQEVSDAKKARWLRRMGSGAVEVQWVTAADSKAAEASFFKINQAAQPIDPTERRILQTRKAPDAISARCIARGAKGHKYWAGFAPEVQREIEQLGEELFKVLYEPPHNAPITTSDVPIAGKGYNALPFVFELVNVSNGIPLPTSASAKKIPDALPEDVDGQKTVEFLKRVQSKLRLVSTNHSGSLGLHPLVYCYSATGNFQPNAFLATVEFAAKIDERGKKNDFTKIRNRFEAYLARNRTYVSLTMSRLGAGGRSLSRVVDLYWSIAEAMWGEKDDDDIIGWLSQQKDFAHLKQLEVPPPGAELPPSKSSPSSSAKSAAFIRLVMESPRRCAICDAAVHSNSVTFDHITRAREGGDSRTGNLQPTHPFCNSGYKS
ncbi:GmrSD restriction endonuclease domain-containing protein [Dinoroseobacter sp. S124A]|uniref:GmrSD restriction endonuclease domain-containing protein n=1 Tax=Dinoroseobacter sp. S124A TaxID=3415128 RepID=UPI003C7AB8D4